MPSIGQTNTLSPLSPKTAIIRSESQKSNKAREFRQLGEALEYLGDRKRTIMIHRGDATGDVSHVLAWKSKNPDGAIIVIGDKKNIADTFANDFNLHQDCCFLNTSGETSGLTKQVENLQTVLSCSINPASAEEKYSNFDHIEQFPSPHPQDCYTALTVTDATREFTSDLRQEEINAASTILRGPDYNPEEPTAKDIALVEMIDKLGIKTDKDTVIFWCRQSGSRGGQYPEQDHSSAFLFQTAVKLTSKDFNEGKNFNVIIAGDFNTTSPDMHDKQTLKLAQSQNREGCGNVTIIGEFWNKEEWTESDTSLGRQDQTRMFYILSELLQSKGHKLVHTGPRSGGIDMYGLGGQSTVYLLNTKPGGTPSLNRRLDGVTKAFKTATTNDSFRKVDVTTRVFGKMRDMPKGFNRGDSLDRLILKQKEDTGKTPGQTIQEYSTYDVVDGRGKVIRTSNVLEKSNKKSSSPDTMNIVTFARKNQLEDFVDQIKDLSTE